MPVIKLNRRKLNTFLISGLCIFLIAVMMISSALAAGDETPPNSDRATGGSESFQTNLFSVEFFKSHSDPSAAGNQWAAAGVGAGL
jgi:hypothetical protein